MISTATMVTLAVKMLRTMQKNKQKGRKRTRKEAAWSEFDSANFPLP